MNDSIHPSFSVRKGFTLIELLVVIAIIGLLAALLFPAVSAAIGTGKKAKAEQMCNTVEAAVMIYINDYNGRLPIEAPYGTSDDQISDAEGTGKDVFTVLMNINTGINSNYALNPKRKVYLETDIPSDDGTYVDPWGTQLGVLLDRDGNKRIKYLSGSEFHRKRVLVVSAGPNRQWGANNSKNSANKDNIANVDLPLIE